MIDFGLTSMDFSHIGVPVDHAGDAVATTAKLGQVPDGGMTNLHINTPNSGDVFENTIYDKNLWTSAPHPADNDKVCGWVHDMAAAEPKSVCDQWSNDDWNAWADHYEDQGCDVPKCGESYPAQLIPYDQSAPADVNAAAQLNPQAAPQLNQIAVVSINDEIAAIKEKPAHFSKIDGVKFESSHPDSDEDMPSQQKSQRSWSMMVKVSKATPAMQNLFKGGDERGFKEDALNNAAAVTPVGQALMTSHLFGQKV